MATSLSRRLVGFMKESAVVRVADLEALIFNWMNAQPWASFTNEGRRHCARELQALLTAAQPPQEAPQPDVCRCGHSSDAHGNDGNGACGEPRCRKGHCKQFTPAQPPAARQEPAPQEEQHVHLKTPAVIATAILDEMTSAAAMDGVSFDEEQQGFVAQALDDAAREMLNQVLRRLASPAPPRERNRPQRKSPSPDPESPA